MRAHNHPQIQRSDYIWVPCAPNLHVLLIHSSKHNIQTYRIKINIWLSTSEGFHGWSVVGKQEDQVCVNSSSINAKWAHQLSCNSSFRERRLREGPGASCLWGQTVLMNSGFVWKTLSQGNKVEEDYKTISNNDVCVLQVHMCTYAHEHTHTHIHEKKTILKMACLHLCNIGVRDSSEKGTCY